jgi:hypothetical protein
MIETQLISTPRSSAFFGRIVRTSHGERYANNADVSISSSRDFSPRYLVAWHQSKSENVVVTPVELYRHSLSLKQAGYTEVFRHGIWKIWAALKHRPPSVQLDEHFVAINPHLKLRADAEARCKPNIAYA